MSSRCRVSHDLCMDLSSTATEETAEASSICSLDSKGCKAEIKAYDRVCFAVL